MSSVTVFTKVVLLTLFRRSTLGRAMKELNIVTARKRNVEFTRDEILQAVAQELYEDPTCGRGPKYVQDALRRKGIHVPRQVLNILICLSVFEILRTH